MILEHEMGLTTIIVLNCALQNGRNFSLLWEAILYLIYVCKLFNVTDVELNE